MKAISDFFYYLTINNWGLPYHFILCLLGTRLLWNHTSIQLHLAALLVLAVATAYEAYQLALRRRDHVRPERDAAQDTLANCLGCVAAMLI